MSYVRFIGDSHSLHDQYVELTKDTEYTVQVGDVGFEYNYLRKHLRVGRDFANFGNHDNYDKNSKEYCLNQPFGLKDYGVLEIPNFFPIFYVRGGWSIDQEWRKGHFPQTWWPEEELSYTELENTIILYKEVKPNFVISHECPNSIVKYVTNPNFVLNFGFEPGTIRTRTSMALQIMFEFHKPAYWIFGHYHQRWQDMINGTIFVCLDMLGRNPKNELAFIDFGENI